MSALRRQQHCLAAGLALVSVLAWLAGVLTGSEGWDAGAWSWLSHPLSWGQPLGTPGTPGSLDASAWQIIGEIRAPRTLGAWLTGALFGLAGAVAQGLFRNPLADPYLLGSAAGASLGVVVSLVLGAWLGDVSATWLAAADTWARLSLSMAAFLGALLGVGLTLTMARGAQHTTRLLLAGVVVGVVFGAVNDGLTLWVPEALRGRQAFLLGTTGLLSWSSCAVLGGVLLLVLPLAWRVARVLDALTLGEDSARSLGLDVPRWRLVLVVVMALATGTAVAQAGMVAFVGLVSPHLVRRFVPAAHGYRVVASAAMGACLLCVADVVSRVVLAPQELPVGVVTAVLGGVYLLGLLQRQGLGGDARRGGA